MLRYSQLIFYYTFMQILNNVLAWKVILEMTRSDSLRDVAIKLDLDTPTVSRLIMSLEEALGTPLFDRSSRPMKATPQVIKALAQIKLLLDTHTTLCNSLKRTDYRSIKRVIRLGMVSAYPRDSLLESIKDYLQLNPNVDIEIATEIDHIDLLEKRIDIAYLLYRPINQDLTLRHVHRLGVFPMASRNYIERMGMPTSPSMLNSHTILRRTARHYPTSEHLYKGLSCQSISSAKELCGDYLTVRTALLSGMGISIDLPPTCVKEAIREGKIVPVLSGWHRRHFDITLALRKEDVEDEELLKFLIWFEKNERLSAISRFSSVGFPFIKRSRELIWSI